MTYAEAAKKLRTTLILSQTELANLLGVSFQTWTVGKEAPISRPTNQRENLPLTSRNTRSR